MGYLLRYLKTLLFFSIFIFFSQIFVHNAYAQKCTGWYVTAFFSLNGTGPNACNTPGWPYSPALKDCNQTPGNPPLLYMNVVSNWRNNLFPTDSDLALQPLAMYNYIFFLRSNGNAVSIHPPPQLPPLA